MKMLLNEGSDASKDEMTLMKTQVCEADGEPLSAGQAKGAQPVID